MERKKISFIGTGVMGAGIVKHLLTAGYRVDVFNRTREKAEHLLKDGAGWAHSIQAAAEDADVIFTMVGLPSDVEHVYFGEQGILENAKKDTIIVDMTTSNPSLAERIYLTAKQMKMHAIDAPVSGGDVGAQNGTLSIMCGGDEEIFQEILPIMNLFGKQVVYQGSAGAGQHTKMCNQIAIATNMIGVCESLAYAKSAGLNLETVLSSISGGAAGSWSLSNLAPRMVAGDVEPGFYIKHFLKDMNIALREAEKMKLPLPGLQMAREMYEELVKKGYSEKGTQALIVYYEEENESI